MGLLDRLFGGKDGGIVGGVGKIIDNLHTSAEEKAAAKLELQRLLLEEQAQADKVLRAELDAQREITVAELRQDDTYTKRARPTIVYVGLAVLVVNYLVAPWVARLWGTELPPIELPAAYWAAWGGITGVYAIGRTAEKRGAANRLTRAITGG